MHGRTNSAESIWGTNVGGLRAHGVLARLFCWRDWDDGRGSAPGARASDWEGEKTVVFAVSSATAEKNKESEKLGDLSIRLLSDTEHANARLFTSYDDFEDMELHSSILIDTKGRVHWKRTGGGPFTDMDFLLQTLKRMNGKPVDREASK